MALIVRRSKGDISFWGKYIMISASCVIDEFSSSCDARTGEGGGPGDHVFSYYLSLTLECFVY